MFILFAHLLQIYTYYIYIHARKEKLRILRQIYRYAGEENMTLDKLLKLLDKNVPLKKEKWNREILLAYLFFRDERDKK